MNLPLLARKAAKYWLCDNFYSAYNFSTVAHVLIKQFNKMNVLKRDSTFKSH